MINPGEVLKKAEALFARQARAARVKAEPDFPLLTDVVEPRIAASAPPAGDMPAPEREPIAESRDRSRLEAGITEQLQRAVALQLGVMLEGPLRERLDSYLRAAVEKVAVRIMNDVEQMVQATVAEAIERVLEGRDRSSGDPA